MTREEAINELEILKENYWDDDGYGHETKQYDDTMLALDMAIKALEQEPILDKIRAEILAMMPPLGKWMYEEGHIEEQTTCEVIADVVQIIDKYTAEREGAK